MEMSEFVSHFIFRIGLLTLQVEASGTDIEEGKGAFKAPHPPCKNLFRDHFDPIFALEGLRDKNNLGNIF